ncbi:hypothetical protein MTO96_044111 [Rhipicephalus appendiculatus]
MENTPLQMTKCSSHVDFPCGITEFLQHMAYMKFEETPSFSRLKRILEKGIQAVGFKCDSRLLFTSPRTPRRNSFWTKKPVQQEIILAENSTEKNGDRSVSEKPASGMVARGRTTPILSSSLYKSLELNGLVKLEPEKKVSISPKKPLLHDCITAEGGIGMSVDESIVEKTPPSKVARGGTKPVLKNKRRSPSPTDSASGGRQRRQAEDRSKAGDEVK